MVISAAARFNTTVLRHSEPTAYDGLITNLIDRLYFAFASFFKLFRIIVQLKATPAAMKIAAGVIILFGFKLLLRKNPCLIRKSGKRNLPERPPTSCLRQYRFPRRRVLRHKRIRKDKRISYGYLKSFISPSVQWIMQSFEIP